jgi:class 3 adenylate cyclase
LEKTGISRATLNNYISWGIVPRPEVLPPEPQDGAAPRIGYFPETVLDRIEEIQRLKAEGWSIARITQHYGQSAPSPDALVDDVSEPAPAHPAQDLARGAMPRLSFEEVAHPAYMLNARFDVQWLNDAARSSAWPNTLPLPADAVSHGIFRYLLQGTAAAGEARQAALRFHLGLARQRGVALRDLARDVAADQVPALERLYGEAQPIEFGTVAQTQVPPGRAGAKPTQLYAVQFREGILVLHVPGEAAAADVSLLLGPAQREAGAAEARRVPALTQVAVLVTELQCSSRLWSELPAKEYFELINHIWMTLEPIFRRHHGTLGRYRGEGMVCYFLPRGDSNYLWSALLAAHQVREAMRRVSKDWQVRKGWATELYMNTGVDEGQEWLGTLRPGAQVEFTVLGDAMNHAALISHFASSGRIWITRNLVDKLAVAERDRLKWGVHRPNTEGRDTFVASLFSRIEHVADLAAPGREQLRAIARLSVTEIVDIAAEPGGTADRPAAQPPH